MGAVMAESHVVSALRQKRAAVTREIHGLERRLGELRAALVHLDGSMRLFADEDRPEPADGPALSASASRLPSVMPRGDMTRLVLDALRRTVGGQSLSRITETVAAAIGVSVEDRKTRNTLSERVRNALYRLRDRNAAEASRDGALILWQLADG